MNDLLQVILLGIIEGITEFLPISSTGHLLLAEQLGLGHRSDLFNIVIQAGAILAVTVIYWDRLWKLATGTHESDNRVYIAKLGVAFLITVVLGLIVKKLGFELDAEFVRDQVKHLRGFVTAHRKEWDELKGTGGQIDGGRRDVVGVRARSPAREGRGIDRRRNGRSGQLAACHGSRPG